MQIGPVNMAIPPYMIPPNQWAQMMAAQQQVFAVQQAQAQAQAQAQQQHQQHAQAHMHAQQMAANQMQMPPMGHIPPGPPKPDVVLTEEKLQEKGSFAK